MSGFISVYEENKLPRTRSRFADLLSRRDGWCGQRVDGGERCEAVTCRETRWSNSQREKKETAWPSSLRLHLDFSQVNKYELMFLTELNRNWPKPKLIFLLSNAEMKWVVGNREKRGTRRLQMGIDCVLCTFGIAFFSFLIFWVSNWL